MCMIMRIEMCTDIFIDMRVERHTNSAGLDTSAGVRLSPNRHAVLDAPSGSPKFWPVSVTCESVHMRGHVHGPCACAYMRMCMCMCICIGMCMCMCMCIGIGMRMCMGICMCTGMCTGHTV